MRRLCAPLQFASTLRMKGPTRLFKHLAGPRAPLGVLIVPSYRWTLLQDTGSAPDVELSYVFWRLFSGTQPGYPALKFAPAQGKTTCVCVSRQWNLGPAATRGRVNYPAAWSLRCRFRTARDSGIAGRELFHGVLAFASNAAASFREGIGSGGEAMTRIPTVTN